MLERYVTFKHDIQNIYNYVSFAFKDFLMTILFSYIGMLVDKSLKFLCFGICFLNLV